MPHPLVESHSQDWKFEDTVRCLIEEAAYEKYVGRGRTDGYDLQDWLEAESEIMNNTTADPQDCETLTCETEDCEAEACAPPPRRPDNFRRIWSRFVKDR